MPATPPLLTASGTIRPCRFIKMSGNLLGAEADANEAIIGLGRDGTDYPPINDSSRVTVSGNLAIDGDPIPMLGDGEIGLVELGGTVTAGNRLKSDADGKAVAAATTGTTRQEYGAIALEGGDAGHKIRCFVQIGTYLPAAA